MDNPSPASFATPSSYHHVSGRDVAALHDARPACLIGARSDAGEVCFATVIWVTPLSHNPAMVAFALREKSHTMGIIRQAGAFSISVPPADEEGVRLVDLCGKNTGRTFDKGAAVAHELVGLHEVYAAPPSNAARTSHGENSLKNSAADPARTSSRDVSDAAAHPSSGLVPIPLHTYSWMACTLESIQQAGDHLLAIGTVTRAATRAPRDERSQLVPSGSLLCVQHGHYAKASALS